MGGKRPLWVGAEERVPFTFNGFYFLLRPSEDLIECSSNFHFLPCTFPELEGGNCSLFLHSALKFNGTKSWNTARKDTPGHKVSLSARPVFSDKCKKPVILLCPPSQAGYNFFPRPMECFVRGFFAFLAGMKGRKQSG